ncbi:MAG TPA: protease inhibitor I42 family protein [Hanamia sp.]|nr:protease inhibitor I42 family protein [Hanamia sp.]
MEIKTIHTNESFDFILKGRGAAGYEWQYKITPEEIVSITRNKTFSKNNNFPIPGSSSDEIFTIKALKKGEAIIHFYLVRTWEDDSILPKEEKEIKVKVE